jgi:hypothetical protein
MAGFTARPYVERPLEALATGNSVDWMQTIKPCGLEVGRLQAVPRAATKHFQETPLSAIDQRAIDQAAIALYPNASQATRNRQVYTPTSAILRGAGVTSPLKRPKALAASSRLHHPRSEPHR